jgi:hypothetical protein
MSDGVESDMAIDEISGVPARLGEKARMGTENTEAALLLT